MQGQTMWHIPSLPLRECGLKYWMMPMHCNYLMVTPLAGVWIEINDPIKMHLLRMVTPLAGVWIEMLCRS